MWNLLQKNQSGKKEGEELIIRKLILVWLQCLCISGHNIVRGCCNCNLLSMPWSRNSPGGQQEFQIMSHWSGRRELSLRIKMALISHGYQPYWLVGHSPTRSKSIAHKPHTLQRLLESPSNCQDTTSSQFCHLQEPGITVAFWTKYSCSGTHCGSWHNFRWFTYQTEQTSNSALEVEKCSMSFASLRQITFPSKENVFQHKETIPHPFMKLVFEPED